MEPGASMAVGMHRLRRQYEFRLAAKELKMHATSKTSPESHHATPTSEGDARTEMANGKKTSSMSTWRRESKVAYSKK